jgi:hypothetical protein
MPVSTHPRAPRLRVLLIALSIALSGAFGPDPARAQSPDYSGWQSLLDRYIVRLGGKNQPAETRFDYEQLYVDEGIWTKKRSPRLEAVHAQLFSVTPSAMDERARLAWAINAYNFLVVERATMLLLVPRRQFQRYESVAQMSSGDGSFFEVLVAQVEGRSCSMAEFERRFVYGDTTPMLEPRRIAADPRLMFALCRGSVGGPSLPVRAFRPESLEVQLDHATRAALALPRMASLDPGHRKLLVSNYLGERLVDFGGTPEGIVPFLVKFGPSSLRSGIKREKLTGVARFTPVDPTLNQFLRPKPPPPAPAAKP